MQFIDKDNGNFWFKYDLNKSTMHRNFDVISVRTHDLQIMTVHFMSLSSVLTTQPSGISKARL